ncbi:MAG: NAD(P)/FAD-dependent oxidoreductase [Anaerolineae bacterium]
MLHYEYIIIGGGLAGGMACEGIRKLDSEGSIALVARETHRPYERPPLSKGYLVGRQGLDKVYLHDEAYYTQAKVDLFIGQSAALVDRSNHVVTLADGRQLHYVKLLLATGGYAWRLPIPGADLPGVLLLRTIEHSEAIHSASAPGKRALVIGGSFIGCEVTAALTILACEVTMVFPETRLLERAVPSELSAHLEGKYIANGVQIIKGVTPTQIEGIGRAEHVRLSNGQVLPVDLVVMGVGIRLDTELARTSGLALDDRGAVLVDEFLATSDPDIYAAGDIASWPDPTFAKRLRVEHWDVAYHQGLRAGRNMAGEGKAYRTLPTFFSDLFDLTLDAWGDLTSWEQTILRGSLDKGSFAFFYFRENTLVGALAVGRSKEEQKAMPALVRAKLTYDLLAEKLADESVDLNSLLPATPV